MVWLDPQVEKRLKKAARKQVQAAIDADRLLRAKQRRLENLITCVILTAIMIAGIFAICDMVNR